jgi:peptide/nickel transport system substrate-binding protein
MAVLGGGTSDTIIANQAVTQPDTTRAMALYNSLVRLAPNGRDIIYDLAKSLTPNRDATEWTVELVRGVTFHDGKELTAEDVIYTFQKIANPKKPQVGYSALLPVDTKHMKALNKYTVRIPMKKPYAVFPQEISACFNFVIIPTHYNPHKPVGTGPFKFDSFTPGQQSVFLRNENYFRSGRPHVDQLVIIDSFASETAAFNALQGGQIDVFGSAPPFLAKQVKGNPNLEDVVSLAGLWIPFTMRVDQAPFNDVRVRQAFRLMVNRKQLVTQALNGYGTVGNDVFSELDACFDHSLKRDQDIEHAKFLLQKAGHAGLKTELVTSDFVTGAVECAQVFAQDAKAAGVTVKIRQVPVSTFYGPSFLRWTFAQDFWLYNPYLAQIAQSFLPTAPYNETHWHDKKYYALYDKANATLNSKRRCMIIKELQHIDFERGGYIIPAYVKQVDLLSKKVNGWTPGVTSFVMGQTTTSVLENAWLE